MWQFEHEAKTRGYKQIAGIDEAGRGPLAGPVVSAAVILPEDFTCAEITDSKKLSEKKPLEHKATRARVRTCLQRRVLFPV